MGERITGGAAFEKQPSVGEIIQEESRRLVGLGDAIAALGASKAQHAEIFVVPYEHGATGAVVTRVKFLEFLRSEQEQIGQRLARILGTMYGDKAR